MPPDRRSQVKRSIRWRAGAAAAFAAFVATVWAANWLVSHFGIVNVGFGLRAPAAVFAVGVAFTIRDVLHREAGSWAVMAAIVVRRAALSWLIAPNFALASGVAFLVSETADLLVYTPLAERTWIGSVVLSNTVGLLLDSWLFLTLALASRTTRPRGPDDLRVVR